MHFFQNGSPDADLEIWHASCQTSRHLTKCRKEWRDVDVHDWQTACHGRLKKKEKKKKWNENYSRLVRAGQILVWRQVEKNALLVDYIFRGVNFWRLIFFFMSLGGKINLCWRKNTAFCRDLFQNTSLRQLLRCPITDLWPWQWPFQLLPGCPMSWGSGVCQWRPSVRGPGQTDAPAPPSEDAPGSLQGRRRTHAGWVLDSRRWDCDNTDKKKNQLHLEGCNCKFWSARVTTDCRGLAR